MSFQGLSIPERVPFRLTPNLIDGMGPLGTEGVFRWAAEHTMNLLKQNAGGLLTILSAIASDPLYKWTLQEDDGTKRKKREFLGKAKKTNGGSHVEKNAEAARAISRIDEKLKGYEDGTEGEQQSVASQVELLLNQAQDVENLSHMFSGWAAYI